MSRELEGEPGVRIVQGLIHEFSASMIVGVLPLTSRLLMLALGPQAFRAILNDYWSKTPPQMFATLEAEAFTRHLAGLDLRVPHLSKVLEFEGAGIATITDGKVRIVQFDFEPVPLFRALAEGRLPDQPGWAGVYEIELTSDSPMSSTGFVPPSVQQAVPFH